MIDLCNQAVQHGGRIESTLFCENVLNSTDNAVAHLAIMLSSYPLMQYKSELRPLNIIVNGWNSVV